MEQLESNKKQFLRFSRLNRMLHVTMILCFLMMRGNRGCMTARRTYRSVEGSAREILDKRYVTGEIGKEEYEEKKRDITQ